MSDIKQNLSLSVWLDRLDANLQDMLIHASTQISEDEEYSELEHQLMALVAEASELTLVQSVFDALAEIVLNETASRPMPQILSIAHALTGLGKMRDLATQSERRLFLERVLKEATNAYTRSSAILGLAYLNNPASLDTIHSAEPIEADRSVKKQLQRVREQLEQTLAEQQ